MDDKVDPNDVRYMEVPLYCRLVLSEALHSIEKKGLF